MKRLNLYKKNIAYLLAFISTTNIAFIPNSYASNENTNNSPPIYQPVFIDKTIKISHTIHIFDKDNNINSPIFSTTVNSFNNLKFIIYSALKENKSTQKLNSINLNETNNDNSKVENNENVKTDNFIQQISILTQIEKDTSNIVNIISLDNYQNSNNVENNKSFSNPNSNLNLNNNSIINKNPYDKDYNEKLEKKDNLNNDEKMLEQEEPKNNELELTNKNKNPNFKPLLFNKYDIKKEIVNNLVDFSSNKAKEKEKKGINLESFFEKNLKQDIFTLTKPLLSDSKNLYELTQQNHIESIFSIDHYIIHLTTNINNKLLN